MKRTEAPPAPRDVLNVLSLLAVLSLCLAVSIFAVIRLAHLDRRLGLAPDAPSVAPTPTRPVTSVSPPGAPAEPQPLELTAAGSSAGVISHGSRARPSVALTFDASMTAAMVQAVDRGTGARFVNDGVIAELRQLKVPATFFLSGVWMEHYPDVARDLGLDPLFELGSYSYSGRAFRAGCFRMPTIDPAGAADDVARSEALLAGATGHPTPFFRFPGGCYDSGAVTAVRSTRVQVVQYDVVPGDGSVVDPSAIVAHTLSSTLSGSIVALNVTGGDAAPATARALPEIVNQLRARGFELVRVSDLLQAGGAG